MMVRRLHAAQFEEPVDVLPVEEPVVQPDTSLKTGFTGAVWDHRNRVWVLWRNGRPIASYGYPSE
jgi:hypothetical protein